jgi:hypothetical protein
MKVNYKIKYLLNFLNNSGLKKEASILEKEIIINAGLKDTSWEAKSGEKVSLEDLLEISKDIPVSNIKLKDIKDKIIPINKKNKKELDRINKAELKYPILVFVDDDEKILSIIDGSHRAQKALDGGLKSIKAKLLNINSMPKNIKKVFSNLL